MKFEATQSGTEARKGRQGQGIEHTCPTQSLCPGTCWVCAAPTQPCFSSSSPGACAHFPRPLPPQAHPSMARQTAGPTHLSRTAWMASAALS